RRFFRRQSLNLPQHLVYSGTYLFAVLAHSDQFVTQVSTSSSRSFNCSRRRETSRSAVVLASRADFNSSIVRRIFCSRDLKSAVEGAAADSTALAGIMTHDLGEFGVASAVYRTNLCKMRACG